MSRARNVLTLSALLLLTSLFALAQDQVYTASGDTVQAPTQLRQVAPPSETLSAEELEVRADALRGQKSYADALDYYRAALKKKETSGLHNKAGISQLQLMRTDDAKKSFQRAVRVDKKNAEAHNNLGVIYYMQQNFRKAVKEYKKAIDLNKQSSSFYSNLGTAEFSRKEYQKASEAYMTALQLDPDVFERRSLAGVQMQMTSPADRASYHYTIAKIYAAKGDAERCLLYLRKAMEEGYSEITKVYTENEFSVVRKDPRFVALMEQKPPAIPQ
jgi:tetratricopeptide (TPR) repeat protein